MHRFGKIVSGQLVVEPTPLKNMSSSVGMMKFPTYGGKIKFMFQTSNQIRSIVVLKSELGTNPNYRDLTATKPRKKKEKTHPWQG
jgi:hypothetical protein